MHLVRYNFIRKLKSNTWKFIYVFIFIVSNSTRWSFYSLSISCNCFEINETLFWVKALNSISNSKFGKCWLRLRLSSRLFYVMQPLLIHSQMSVCSDSISSLKFLSLLTEMSEIHENLKINWDVPGSPAVRTWCFHWQRLGSVPGQGN